MFKPKIKIILDLILNNLLFKLFFNHPQEVVKFYHETIHISCELSDCGSDV